MITGDIPETAAEIGRQAGIVSDITKVLSHDRFVELSDNDVNRLLDERALEALARALPEDKERLVGLLQARGEVVGMTGDGVNDAAALASADLGMALAGGTDAAMDSADIVIMGTDLSRSIEVLQTQPSKRTNRESAVG